METLKKYFPFAFKEKNDLSALIINIIILLVVGIVVGALIGILKISPIINIIIGLIGSLFDLYIFVTIVLSILDYFKILK